MEIKNIFINQTEFKGLIHELIQLIKYLILKKNYYLYY